jgi:hypothetical protein
MISYKNIKLQRVEDQQKGKAKYLVNGNEYFTEEAVINHYESLGYKAIWSENSYWWMLMSLFFWDVIFARIRGAVSVVRGGIQIELDPDDIEFERIFEHTIQLNGMPSDFFAPEFYERRQNLIKNKIQELLYTNLEQKLNDSYKNNYGKNCRPIEDWKKYKIDELLISIQKIDKEKLLKILERLITNFNDNRSGLPDLIVFNSENFFFSEVKSEKDKLSDKQIDWHTFLSETLGLKVEICLINHIDNQIKQIEAAYTPSSKEVIVTFGHSSSGKREEAIKFMQEQQTYFTQGEGKEQLHGAKFKINDIEKLYKILDLTSGWKSQKIEIDGEVVKSTDLRNSLWCFREKNRLNASSDYCKRREYDNQLNKFGCRNIYFNELENEEWRNYGYVDTTKGEWIFDHKKINEKIEQEIARLRYCPLFDANKVRNLIKKIPGKINPQIDKDWAFISSNFEKWFWHENRWLNTLGETNFLGFSVMIGVQKLPRKEINEAARYSKENNLITIRYKEPVKKTRQKTGCFIATVIYGDCVSFQVKTLRYFRDNFLEQQFLGKTIISFYYRVGPPLAWFIGKSRLLKSLIKKLLDIIIKQINR